MLIVPRVCTYCTLGWRGLEIYFIVLAIDGQVRLVRLQMNTSVCFVVHKRTNDKLPFAR